MSKVIEQLTLLQADSNVLFVKFHNYHWNIKGFHFMPIHKYTEELYDEMAVLFDDVAERILQLGGTPLVTLKQILAKAKIEEESATTFDDKHALKSVEKDLIYLKNECVKLGKIAVDADDTTTQAMAEDKVASLEKQLWILRATLA